MRFKTFLTLVLSVFSLSLSAGKVEHDIAAIEGHVIDARTKEPIAYANIGILNTTMGTITNSEGDFVFRTLKPGKYVVKASSMGYKSKEITVIVEENKTVHAHFELEESVIMFDEIVVSANRNEVKRKDAPVIVNVVSQKNFESNNAQDLSQALIFQSGVRVENDCQNCGSTQVRLNGLDGPYTQMLIDSRPILSALGSVYGLEQIPVNMIERIEIVKGGGSALYGSNAIAGSINIITKEATRPSFSISTDAEMIGKHFFTSNYNMNGALVNSDMTSGVSFYQTFRNRNPYDHTGDSFSEISELGSFSFGTKVYHKPSPTQKITAEYHATKEDRRGGNMFDRPVHEADLTEMTDHRIHGGGLTYNFISNDGKNRYSGYVSTQHVDRDSYFGAYQDPNAFGRSSDITCLVGATGNNDLDKLLFTKATLTYGLEYNVNHLRDEMVGYNKYLDQLVNIFGGFAQSEWKSEYINFLLGGRLEKNSMIKGLVFSPRANLLYKPSENIQARASYANGYRAPQAYDEDLHVLQVGGDAVILQLADDLKHETSNSYSLSLDYYRDLSDDFQTNVLIEGFLTTLHDAFALRDLGFDIEHNAIIKERYNASCARIMGISVTGKLAFRNNHSLSIGFTQQSSRFRDVERWSSDKDVEGTRKMLRTPDSYGFMTLTSELTRKWNVALTGTYTGSMLVPHKEGYIEKDKLETTPDFWDINLSTSYDIRVSKSLMLQLSGGVKNIFNSFQKDHDIGVDRDADYVYGPMQPRTVFLALKLLSI